jgi:hypothetical protein
MVRVDAIARIHILDDARAKRVASTRGATLLEAMHAVGSAGNGEESFM